MAQMQDMRGPATGQRSSISTLTNLMGAAASLALLVGIGVWSYQLLMRDVSGVPVVRAAEGPMRVQPENPGGQQAQHQGLSVNGVAAEGTAADPADRLVLAPAPLELTVEDEALPSVGQGITQEAASTPSQPADEPETTNVVNPEDLQLAAVEQLATQLSEGVTPLQELEPAPEAAPETATDDAATDDTVTDVAPEVLAAIAAQSEVEGGLGRSLRPKLRPATLSNVQQTSAVQPASGPSDIDPAAIPAGTRLAQLGAFESAEVARAEWDRLQGQFSEYLEGKDRVVQKATSGGRTFYRLRAMGFADLSDARRFCSALVAEKAECIPVVTR
ncbi:SPOR domain-containing protein [Roseovarius sp. 2305UL8-3]|uniref:SPOR domain-containing protein n=1 Tax=Roseovarius conchicola TaxID=3121636 RepID=UPI003528584F